MWKYKSIRLKSAKLIIRLIIRLIIIVIAAVLANSSNLFFSEWQYNNDNNNNNNSNNNSKKCVSAKKHLLRWKTLKTLNSKQTKKLSHLRSSIWFKCVYISGYMESSTVLKFL